MDGFQKFLRMVDGHESWIKKMAGAKKVVKLKNQFFHARQPRKIIFDICTY